MKKIFFISFVFVALSSPVSAFEYKGEKIVYAISPVGHAEYCDTGIAEFQGRDLRLVTFRTRVPGFDDLEKIYAEPKSGLPIRVERYISWPFSKEYLSEDYNPKENSLIIRDFVGGKLVKEYPYKGDGPMHNAILLPFYLRTIKDPPIGWSMIVRLPDRFKVTLSAIEDVRVPAGSFKAYHFTSDPLRFDIWITVDEPRIPVKIKGSGGLGYTMVMESHER